MNRAWFGRHPVARPQQNRGRHTAFPSPTRGWITNENLDRAKSGGARVLENWFPEFDGVRLRGGATKVATIGSDPVVGMFRYVQGGVERLFAASDSDIYNITSLDPDTPPSADVSSLTNGYWSSFQMATSGGYFLYALNDADDPRLYNASTWQAVNSGSSPISITGVTTNLLRQGWVYRNRAFFCERNSLRAWYLPTESVGGAASDIELSGVFNKGGHLLFGATWSLDAGDGVDDKCVFVTDLGEIAVYEGADPGDANDWNLVGRYDAGKPLGKNAHFQAGGDLLIATDDGIVPLTEIIRKDPAALSVSAVSRPIEPDWKVQSRQETAGYPWHMVKWPRRNMAIVSLPHTTLSTPEAWVVNLQTGAWAKYVGWDIQSMALFGTGAYFGDASGSVYEMESGGKDGTSSYVCKLSMAPDHLGAPHYEKTATLARATFLSGVAFNPQLGCDVDLAPSFPAAPSAAADTAGAGVWDVGLWDQAIWDDGSGELFTKSFVNTRWQSVVGHGIYHSPRIQVTVGNDRAPDAKLISMDLTYEQGGLVA